MKGLMSFFAQRAGIPIETRDYGRIYLVLSGLLFLGTMWAVVDEISTRRPWKETQGEYFTLSAQRWGDKLKEAQAAFDSAAYSQLRKDLQDAEARLSSPEALKQQQ